ncbi:MAG: hypothetical protein ACI81V_000730 [Lentimonas sp.]|jgi:hypothetical protein
MDSVTKITTRKGFLKRTGAAIVGVFGLSTVAVSKSQPTHSRTAQVEAPRALSRVRPAEGAVQYKTTGRV